MALPPHVLLLQTFNSFFTARAIVVAAKLGIPDLLKGGPMPIEEIATKITNVNTESLYRTLRALHAAGIFEEVNAFFFFLSCCISLPEVFVQHE